MESQLSSSGIFLRNFFIGIASKDSGVFEDLNLEIELSSCPFFNEVDWNKKNNEGKCLSHSEEIKEYAKRFSRGRWTFLGTGSEEKWYGSCLSKPEGKWNSVAATMRQRFMETSNFYTGTSALSRGALKRKENRNTIHFTAESSSVKLLFRIIHSANQLSVYGAVPRNAEEANSLVGSAKSWYAFWKQEARRSS